MKDLGLLVMRLTAGGLMAGHGAQKLFGWFGGHGLEGTGGWLESMGLRPGKRWALLAGGSEFGSGVLTALGLLSPLGPLGMLAPMAIATGKVHRGKPIWVAAGGAELPLTNVAAVTSIAIVGTGGWTLDRLLGIRLPRWLFIPGVIGAVATAAYGLKPAEGQDQPAPSQAVDAAAEEAGAALEAGAEAEASV